MTLPTDPVIRSEADANRYLTPAQVKAYLDTYGRYSKSWQAAVNALKGGYHNLKLSQMLGRIGQQLDQNAAAATAMTGVQVAGAAAHPNLVTARTLSEVNQVMAAEWVAKLIGDGAGKAERQQAVKHAAINLGAVPTIGVNDAAAVLAVYVAQLADAQGVVLDDWLAAYAANPNVDPVQLRAELQPAGSGSMLSEIGGRLLRFARRVFVTGLGRLIRDTMNLLLRAGDDVPWLSQYFLQPLGFHLQAVALRELGNAMVDGSVRSFNAKKVARATATTFQAAGTALLAASPFLPPPWNVAAAAAGALSVAGGNLIHRFMDASEEQARLDAQAAQQQQQLQAQYDAQAQQEAQAAQQQEQQQGYVTDWARYPDGQVLWTAFWRAGGQLVPVWAWVAGTWYSLV